MISTGEVKKGVIIELDGQLMKVLDWSHIKMARGSAQVRMKLQNVRKGDIVERTFQAGTRWPRARVEQRKVQYLYSDGDAYHFMDTETYDQFTVPAALLGDDARYLVETTEVFVSSHESEILGVDLP
ncbi:MAG: elongation factor P, partial [Chloroflexota bacterium]|nr:elongation factor P [Chloroflexota bacterium]